MSRDLNKCCFIGRLGADPVVKYLPSGGAVVSFSIACSADYKDKTTGNNIEQTNWINIVAFNRLAEVIGEFLTKGSQVYMEGSQRTRKWQGQDGSDNYTTEVVAREMQMLGGKKNESQQQSQQPQQQPPSAPQGFDEFDSDLPF